MELLDKPDLRGGGLLYSMSIMHGGKSLIVMF